MFSIVIPTYNERKNIGKLISRINKICKKYRYEIIVVDDNSPDGTSEVVKKLNRRTVKVITRKKRGLTSAILDGIKKSRYDTICVMDADFSHDPFYIPEMIDAIKENDIVIGSRYIRGGRTVRWPMTRKAISYAATASVRPFVRVNDPLSGYIAFRKKTLKNAYINENAAKISLEILQKCKYKNIKEIPIVFSNRKKGKSAFMNMDTAISYIKQMSRIYIGKRL